MSARHLRFMRARHRRLTAVPEQNDALAHGLAMVAVPLVFGLLGAYLDGSLGTGPLLLIAFAAFGVAGSFCSAYYRYEARMARHDEGKPWTRRAGATGTPGVSP